MVLLDGAMFVLDDKTRHKAPNEHIFNKGAINRTSCSMRGAGSWTSLVIKGASTRHGG